jgi:hypothetical protein
MAAALVAVAVAVAVLRTQQDRSRDFLHNPIKILSALHCVKSSDLQRCGSEVIATPRL